MTLNNFIILQRFPSGGTAFASRIDHVHSNVIFDDLNRQAAHAFKDAGLIEGKRHLAEELYILALLRLQ